MIYEETIKIEIEENQEKFNEIEEKVKFQAFGAAIKLITKIMKDYETKWINGHKSAEIRNYAQGRFVSIFGEFSFERIKVRHKGRTFYPLDDWSEITPYKRETPSFQKLIRDEYVERTFRKGTKNIFELSTVKMSHTSGWKSFQDQAEKEKNISILPARIKNIPINVLPNGKENPCPVLCVEEDGTYCKAQPDNEKDRDVKMAILYTKKKYVGKKHKKAILENKTIVSARQDESLDSFTARVAYVASNVYKVNDKTEIILRGDGDSWILRFKNDHYPEAHYFLDWWHVKKKMHQTFGEEEAKRLMEYVYSRNPEKLLTDIGRKYLAGQNDPLEFDKINAFYNYIENNKEGLQLSGIDPEFKKEHPGMFKRGSGAMERNIDLLVGERCKLKRMSWSEKGLDNMVFLREKKLNREINSPVIRHAA